MGKDIDFDSVDSEIAEKHLKAKLKRTLGGIEEKRVHLQALHARPVEQAKVIAVTIVGARNLDNRDFGGKSDPFCKVLIGREQRQTRVEWDTMAPDWNETFTLPFNPAIVKKVTFELYDHDTMSPAPLGRFEVDVRALQLDEEVGEWVKLERSKKGEFGYRLRYHVEVEEDEEAQLKAALRDQTPTTPQSAYEAPCHARSPAYQAMEVTIDDLPADPWSVLHSNAEFLTDEELEYRTQRLISVYGDWDMDGSGRIEFDEIQQIVASFRGVDDQAVQLRMLRKWGTLVNARQIPKSGYDRDTLIPFIIRLTNEYKPHEFERFLDHILETIQVMLDITDTGRKIKATWRLFKAWDTNQNLTLDTNQLEHIIAVTQFGLANPEKLAEQVEVIRKAKPECEGVDDVGIKEFHEFMNEMLDGVSEMEMNFVYGQIRTAMREEKLEDPHVVSKYMNMNRKLFGGDRPAEGQETEDDKLTDKLMMQLQSNARHAFDSLTLDDVETALNVKDPTSHYPVVATPICILFGVGPAQHVKTGKLCFWQGLREFIIDDPARCLHFLQNFEASYLPYEMAQKMMIFHFMEESDPHFLLFQSRFLSCLCVWCENTVRLACMINDWEYPPPPIEDEELMAPTFAGSKKMDKLADTPGFLREYPAPVRLGIDRPARTLGYQLPKWGYVRGWVGGSGEEKVLPPREAVRPNRPTTCISNSGALGRLAQMLERRIVEFKEGRYRQPQ